MSIYQNRNKPACNKCGKLVGTKADLKQHVAKSHTVRNKKKNSAQEEKQSGRRNDDLNAGIVKADEIEEVEPYSDSEVSNSSYCSVTASSSSLDTSSKECTSDES